MKIICSSRNFFPKGAWAYSTNKQTQIAKNAGYDGINFLATWRFTYEMLRFGKLLAPVKFISGAHRDWRFDRVMEARVKNKPWWLYQFKNKEDWLFPPSNFCLEALRKFQKVYKKPVSVMWFKDAKNFSPVILELWNTIQGINQNKLMAWLKKDKKNRGVVIDTLKFSGWLKSNRLENRGKEVLEELMPFIVNVDYRAAKKNREKSLAVTQGKMEESKRLFNRILKMGYKGDVVVEFGWPDLESSPFGIVKEDLSAFKKLHLNIIGEIKKISE